MVDSTVSNDPLIGTAFAGKYQIVSKLGSGGMGGIYKAEHTLMQRVVAIKMLRSHLLDDEVLLRRFSQEARTASQLTHPNAVMLYDFGVENRVPYLVMEYIEGDTLSKVIAAEKNLDLYRVKSIMHQVCGALAEAHRLGIVHRDLKPDNIMLRRREDGSDFAKVLDFGIAKIMDKSEGAESNLTQAGILVGTPQYMSPEQCQGRELDTRSDLFSLGIVLYEMLAGETPFKAPSVLELMVKVLNSPVQPLRKLKPELGIPSAVDKVVMKSLEKERENRYQTVQELLVDLEKAIPEKVTSTGIKAPNEGGSGAFRPKWQTPASLAGGLLALAGVAYFVIPSGESISRVSPVTSDDESSETERKLREEAIAKEAEHEAEAQRLVAEAKRAQAEKEAALMRAEQMKRDAEALAKQAEEAERQRQIQLAEQQQAAERAERERAAAVRDAELARTETERLMAEMKRGESERAKLLEEQLVKARALEEEKARLLRQAEAAKEEAAKLVDSTKKNEAELLKSAEAQKEALRRADAEKEAAVKSLEQARVEAEQKERAAKELEAKRVELQRQLEQKRIAEQNKATVGEPKAVSVEAARAAEERVAEERRRAAEAARLEASRRREEEARRAREEELVRVQREARRRRELEEQQREQARSTPPPQVEPPAETETKKVRRRCGPTWCTD